MAKPDFDVAQSVADVRDYLMALQNTICQALADIDGGARFEEDVWQSELGQGRSRVLSNGNVFEQAGVNFSFVSGKSLPAPATSSRPELAGCSFHATGVSLVLHPKNPYVPTTHMNVRIFAAIKKDGTAVWWFGGGYDLTPYYGFDEDCEHWHVTCKKACDPYGEMLYPRFKQWADEYFYLKHRKEPRGIGGIFFDDFNELSFEESFAFMRSVGDSFLTAYLPIVKLRKNLLYGDRERQFQLYRRGRYVEFNLVYDRGTHFGLQFGGRTESILMSLPPLVRWEYNYQPEANTPEAKLYTHFLKPQDWVSLGLEHES